MRKLLYVVEGSLLNLFEFLGNSLRHPLYYSNNMDWKNSACLSSILVTTLPCPTSYENSYMADQTLLASYLSYLFVIPFNSINYQSICMYVCVSLNSIHLYLI